MLTAAGLVQLIVKRNMSSGQQCRVASGGRRSSKCWSIGCFQNPNTVKAVLDGFCITEVKSDSALILEQAKPKQKG